MTPRRLPVRAKSLSDHVGDVAVASYREQRAPPGAHRQPAPAALRPRRLPVRRRLSMRQQLRETPWPRPAPVSMAPHRGSVPTGELAASCAAARSPRRVIVSLSSRTGSVPAGAEPMILHIAAFISLMSPTATSRIARASVSYSSTDTSAPFVSAALLSVLDLGVNAGIVWPFCSWSVPHLGTAETLAARPDARRSDVGTSARTTRHRSTDPLS